MNKSSIGIVMGVAIALSAVAAWSQGQEEGVREPAKGSLPQAGHITGNIRVRLTAAAISITRGQNLLAKFSTIPPANERPKEISLMFPCHSFTTHEATLINVVRGCVDWKDVKDSHDWHPVVLTATFSVPPDVEERGIDYSKWFLVSLEVPEKKK